MYPYDGNRIIMKQDKKGQPIPREDLFYLYMELNYPAGVVAEILGTSPDKVRKWLKHYEIKKSKEQRILSDKLMFTLKYGVDNPRKLQETIDKTKDTCMQKYGHVCALHGKEAKRKTKETSIRKYGVEIPASSKEVQNKRKQNNLEKYGVEYTVTLPEVKEKIRNSWDEIYSDPEKVLEVNQKREQTCLIKYNCKTVSQNKEIKEKISNAIKNRTEEQKELTRKKTESTCLQKYGVTNPMQCNEIKDRAVNTCIDRYGVAYPIQLDEFKEKRNINNIEKCGTTSISNSHLSFDTLKIISSRDNLLNYIGENKINTVSELAESLQISYSGIQHKLHQFNLWDTMDHYTSTYEVELNQLLPDFSKNRKVLYPLEIDLYNEQLKLGVEFNGSYWHSTNLKDKKYHQEKSLLAEESGIFIYHIFEYEWNNSRIQPIIKSQLNNLQGFNKVIGARKCELKTITAMESNTFLNDNHIQGEDKSSTRYGLFYENELVSVMTFCKPRFTQKYSWELSRFCNKVGYNIMGGASKLFKHFIRNYPNDSIISYSNISKTKGNLYSVLGFKLDHISKPNYVWVLGDKVLSRYQCQKHLLKEFSNLGNTEDEIMIARNFMKIYDCGSKVWIYQP